MTCWICGDPTSPPETFGKGEPVEDQYVILVCEDDEFEFCSADCFNKFGPEAEA